MLKKNGLLLVLATALISGFSIFLNSFGVKGFDSSVFTFSKNVVVAMLLLSFLFATTQLKEFKKLNKTHWYQLMGIGFIGGSIPFLLFFKGLQLTTGKTSAFIHKTLFVYVAIFALIFLKEKLNKGLVIGAILLLAGNYFFIAPDLGFTTGHLLIFGATLFWAAENTLSKHVLKELGGTMVAFGRMFFGSLFIFLFLLFTGKVQLIATMSLAQYGWIALTALLLLGYVGTYYNGLKHIKVTTAASILALGSPITTALSLVFRGQSVSLGQAFGMLLLLSGVFAIVMYSEKWGSVVPVHARG